MVEKDVLKYWNSILSNDGLALIEDNNQVFPEVIDSSENPLEHNTFKKRAMAIAWLLLFKESKLEKVRYGEKRGQPNFTHKRIIEFYAKGLSTRKISTKLQGENVLIGYQGVARIIVRYLGE